MTEELRGLLARANLSLPLTVRTEDIGDDEAVFLAPVEMRDAKREQIVCYEGGFVSNDGSRTTEELGARAALIAAAVNALPGHLDAIEALGAKVGALCALTGSEPDALVSVVSRLVCVEAAARAYREHRKLIGTEPCPFRPCHYAQALDTVLARPQP